MVTVHGLDIGIHADMTVFSSLSALVYNGESRSLGTSKINCYPFNFSSKPVTNSILSSGEFKGKEKRSLSGPSKR